MKILFMCMENSALSPMAEGLARDIFKDQAKIESIGLIPKEVNPLAIRSMAEVGIDISQSKSKNMVGLSSGFFMGLNYFIFLSEAEISLVLPIADAKKLNWPLPDPSAGEGSEEEKLDRFRKVRDSLRAKIEALAQEIAKGQLLP